MSESDVSDLLTVAQAIAIIDAAEVSPRMVQVALHEADGLVLAEDLRADRDYPPFDKSLMDGFAVRSANVANVPCDLRVVGEIPAGSQADRGFADHEAIAIMTGAPLPKEADGVIPIEDVERIGSSIRIRNRVTPGRFIARRGSDVRAGDVVLSKGIRIGPAQLAVAASIGANHVAAFAKPCAAVLGTGDELVTIDRVPGPAQIRNSNNIMLVSLLKRLGCDVTDLGVVRDDPKVVRDALENGMRFDALFVTGGMSMGEYDYVPKMLLDLKVDLRITKLRIKPGKPFVFGVKTIGGATSYVFGLPGNPVSGFVCTVRLASRWIARMSGLSVSERWLEGKLSASLGANGPREFYQPVMFDGETVVPLGWKGSADVFTLARANALLARAENEPAQPAGTRVRVLEI
jgi:molybdopterin molybdotransferase